MKIIRFSALIGKEGVNPFVDPPLGTGLKLGRQKGVISVRVLLEGKPFRANLVPLGPKRTKAAPGRHHRLYLNGPMRKAAGKDLGDRIKVSLTLDRKPPVEPMPKSLSQGLQEHAEAGKAFRKLSPSRQKELKRYLNHLKSPEAIRRNTDKILRYLLDPRVGWFGKRK